MTERNPAESDGVWEIPASIEVPQPPPSPKAPRKLGRGALRKLEEDQRVKKEVLTYYEEHEPGDFPKET